MSSVESQSLINSDSADAYTINMQQDFSYLFNFFSYGVMSRARIVTSFFIIAARGRSGRTH